MYSNRFNLAGAVRGGPIYLLVIGLAVMLISGTSTSYPRGKDEPRVSGISERDSVHAASHGSIRITGAPPATVFIDGDSIGVTPVMRALSSGEHEIRLRRDSLHEVIHRIMLEAGTELTLSTVPWQLNSGLMVHVKPWARVYIDGLYRETTPFQEVLPITPGEHLVELRHDRLGAWKTRIRVPADSVYVLHFDMGGRFAEKED